MFNSFGYLSFLPAGGDPTTRSNFLESLFLLFSYRGSSDNCRGEELRRSAWIVPRLLSLYYTINNIINGRATRRCVAQE